MRKEIDFTVTTEGRDKGKVFHIQEMGALQAERWALRALQAAVRGGVDIADEVVSLGMRGVVVSGIRALFSASYDEISPLLEEMMACVTIKPDPRNPQITRPILEDDIEEVRTLIDLRMEVLKLHTDFFAQESPSTSESPGPKPEDLRNTSTSRPQSRQSSPAGARR